MRLMDVDLRLSEVMAALSHALDISDGHPAGHATRTCLIGMRLADNLELEPADRSALFYGLLLKDLGCSSNAARLSSLYGADDHVAKRNAKRIDQTRLPEALAYIVRNSGGVRDLLRVLAAGARTMREVTETRCERGAEIARMLELPEATAQTIYSIDEHWDGKGHPHGLAGEEIPVLARIACLAQTTEVFVREFGLEAALEMAGKRSGRWFDPALVMILRSFGSDREFWHGVESQDAGARVAALEPDDRLVIADEARLDRVAEAFAQVIDAKSPFTARHSERVAAIAVATATTLGFSDESLRDLRRAGLLHDIGKLAISNLILDKPGKLTVEEFEAVKRHPLVTEQILGRVSRFADIAGIAAAHHEKLDGSGYHRGIHGDELDPPARVLAVADIFEAMTADRPYRQPMEVEQALGLMRLDVGVRICPEAFAALERSADALDRAA
jgi:HD-GYP domain-containing protein (c-di-GMP phosphodiesterase class II)